MVKRNKYRRKINGRDYHVHIFEGFLHTTVAVKSKRYNGKTYTKARKWFAEEGDVESLAAKLLSRAVEKREDSIQESKEYDERMERVLDIVEGEYEGDA